MGGPNWPRFGGAPWAASGPARGNLHDAYSPLHVGLQPWTQQGEGCVGNGRMDVAWQFTMRRCWSDDGEIGIR